MPTINDRAWYLKRASEAEANAKWHIERANACLRKDDRAGYRDHMDRAKIYQRDAADKRYVANKCTR